MPLFPTFHIQSNKRKRNEAARIFPSRGKGNSLSNRSSRDTSITLPWKGTVFPWSARSRFFASWRHEERDSDAPLNRRSNTTGRGPSSWSPPKATGWYCTCSRCPGRQLANLVPSFSRRGKDITDEKSRINRFRTLRNEREREKDRGWLDLVRATFKSHYAVWSVYRPVDP